MFCIISIDRKMRMSRPQTALMANPDRAQAEVPMKKLSLEKVFDLLGQNKIPGSDKELKALCIRISELVESNGENWIRENRQKLLLEWEYIVQQGIIGD